MNRKLLALAIGTALVLPVAAQAAPTVYGQLNLSADYVNFDDGLNTPTSETEEGQVNSNASRIGVKGEESLGGGLSAVYKAEWEIAGDVTGGADLNGRDRFLGLKGGFGTVKLGAYDSPLKDSQGSVDQFDDMNFLDMGNVVTGEERLNNVIGYESPKIADLLTVNAAVQSGETTTAGTGDDDDGVSVAVAVETNGFYAAVAMDNNVRETAATETTSRDAMRVTVTYGTDAFQVGAMLQTSELSDSNVGVEDEEALLISGAYNMGKNTIKAQLITSTIEFGPGAEEETQVIALGLDHNFTQMTKAFAQVGMGNTDLGAGVEEETTVLTVGMQTKF
ncbi:MAG: outer rane porin [Moraxellaceae bacterium]|nr:outer rane porin [Moraxellaceae bacterium]